MLTNFILMLSVCSVVSNVCTENITYPKKLETHHTCLLKGYEIGLDTVKSLNKEEANKYKLYVTFTCIEQQGEST